jgi:hypothetical protein
MHLWIIRVGVLSCILRPRLMSFSLGTSVVLVGWSIIEPGMYLIAACLLTLRPMFAQLNRKCLKPRLYHGTLSKEEHDTSSSSRGLHLTGLVPARSHSWVTQMQCPQGGQVITGATAFPHQSVSSSSKILEHDVERGLALSSQPQGIRVDSDFRITTSDRGDKL